MAEELFRLSGLPPYVFAEVNAMKAAARRRGEDVIDLGMGNPDGPPPPHVVQKLVETLNNPKVHGYSTSRGIPGLDFPVSIAAGRGFACQFERLPFKFQVGERRGMQTLFPGLVHGQEGLRFHRGQKVPGQFAGRFRLRSTAAR